MCFVHACRTWQQKDGTAIIPLASRPCTAHLSQSITSKSKPSIPSHPRPRPGWRKQGTFWSTRADDSPERSTGPPSITPVQLVQGSRAAEPSSNTPLAQPFQRTCVRGSEENTTPYTDVNHLKVRTLAALFENGPKHGGAHEHTHPPLQCPVALSLLPLRTRRLIPHRPFKLQSQFQIHSLFVQ